MSKKVLISICTLLLFLTGCSFFGDSKKDYSSYVGVWNNNDSSVLDYEVIINSIKDDKVSFDYLIYRVGEFNNIEAKLEDGAGSFNATNDMNWTVKGTIKLDDNKVVLDITDSSDELISKGKVEFKKGEKALIKENNNASADVDVNGYIGVWRNDDSSNPVDEFIINSVNNNQINFDYLIDGITSFEGVSATLDGNKANFEVVNELGWTIKGYFVMENDQVFLTITESSNENIATNSTVYTLHRDKSKLK